MKPAFLLICLLNGNVSSQLDFNIIHPAPPLSKYGHIDGEGPQDSLAKV